MISKLKAIRDETTFRFCLVKQKRKVKILRLELRLISKY